MPRLDQRTGLDLLVVVLVCLFTRSRLFLLGPSVQLTPPDFV